jgi:arabinofuranan 3-O-arabinosyltransferase
VTAFEVQRDHSRLPAANERQVGQHRVRRGRLTDYVALLGAGPPGQRKISSARLTALVWLAVLFLLLTNQPGRIFYDTKLGVGIDPVGFAQRLWHLWNPQEWFGTLQDQYIGYAFPMLPFYLAGHLLNLPVWLTERLWVATLISAGFLGFIKLATALRIGSDRSRILAGLAFVLWPTFTIVIGSTTALAIAGLVAPWAVLPLVPAARDGPLARAAARSGLAVLFMGGVNATVTFDALVLPAMFILVQTRGRRRVRLACYWLVAMVLATSWWVVPLVLQGKYSFNFLPFIEQSSATSATMSAAAFLRGAGNWTAYLNFGRPWLSAGWEMIANPFAVLAAAGVAGLGLLGLARRDLPSARWLRLSLGVVALFALAGYPGPLGGPFHGVFDQLLNTTLAPLRSVYKLEPAVAAILALGIAHALSTGYLQVSAHRDELRQGLWRVAVLPAAAIALAGLSLPYLSRQLTDARSFAAIPGYWYRVAGYLRQHSPDTPALVVPAVAHGTYLWGDSIDDPLEPLAQSPWVERGLVPYGGAASQLLLISLERAFDSGEQVDGLGTVLNRSGIRYIVVRNDLAPSVLGYVSPQTVHATLLSSGFRRVAAFGPLVTGAQTDPGATPGIQRLEPSYPAVEVFESDTAAGPPAAPVRLFPVSQTMLVNGGPDALLQLAGQHLLPSQPVVIAGDPLVTRPAYWAVTDSLRRADHAFGTVDAAESYTYTGTGTNPPDDPLGGGGGPPRQLLPVAAGGHQTVAVLSGAVAVTASSAGSWAGETQQYDPVNAFDGNPRTSWVEANPTSPVGQWIQITFTSPRRLPATIRIELLDDGQGRALANRLSVSTQAGTADTTLRATAAAQPLRMVPGESRWLRITITGAQGGVAGGPGAGFREVLIPGVKVTRFLQPAQAAAGAAAPVTTFSFQRLLPSPASLANIAQYPPMARTFLTAAPGKFVVAGLEMAVPGRALTALLSALTPFGRDALQVTASSTWGSLPRLAPAGLFNVRAPSPWIAGGANPILHLRWHGDRRIGRITFTLLTELAARPATVSIRSPNGSRWAFIGSDGVAEIVPPLTTSHMSMSFPVVRYDPQVNPFTRQTGQLPVGLAAIKVPALAGLTPAAPDLAARFSLTCGTGPRLLIDGRSYPTAISGTIGDLVRFRPVQVRLCARGSAIWLDAGRHWLSAAVPGAFSLTDLSLTSATASPASASVQSTGSGAVRWVRVLAWGYEHRQVRVGPGPAAYLELHQNANPGWIATLNGRRLTPVRLDGWQQGYVIPAGAGGLVDLSFPPGSFYQSWIVAAAAGPLALAIVAFAVRRRRSHPGGIGLPAEPNRRAWLGALAVCGMIAVIGGPVALAVPVLVVVARRWPRWLGPVACAAMIASGCATVAARNPGAAGSGAFGPAAQACALVALAAALMPGLSGPEVQEGPVR